jgi:lipopolysaccharide/colanic/teichoic acid biosynthesis glycosyltransferase
MIMYKNHFKRDLDISFSLIALIILSPLLIPVVIILLLTGEHYVFYGQNRMGYKNKKFKILKFATMLKNSPNIGTGSITTRNDPRVFPFGRFLRKTKLNELPQILNILKGDISLIGPRPLMEVDFKKYDEEIQSKIYNIKPGLTGIGSVIFRDEQKLISETTMPLDEFYKQHISPYKGALELWYQDNLTFATDFKILFLTGWVILFSDSKLPQKMFKNLPAKLGIEK